MAKASVCRNCFHSYVCEQFNENKDDNNEKCHFLNDHYVPIADVVPKSEAENYKKIAEHQQSVSMRRYFEIKQLKEELAKTKQEVAREIFEEIERTFNAVLVGDISDILKVLTTLKKKYTEGKNG